MKLLLEIGTEDLPAGQVMPALEFLSGAFKDQAAAARLSHGEIEIFGTPRRLGFRVNDLDETTQGIRELRQGPSVTIAFDPSGNPTKAGLGFARGQGANIEDLTRIETDKGEYVALEIEEPGKPTEDILPVLIEEILSNLPWPKPMRWGWSKLAWGRPVHWIVALLDNSVLPLSFAGVESGDLTYGHRFLVETPTRISSPDVYEQVLGQTGVIPSINIRQEKILNLAEAAVTPNSLVDDGNLLEEVTQLVESPQCAVGTFDPEYLKLPREVLISEMRNHQRYFAVETPEGELTNQFVVIYNTPVSEPDVVIKGNQRVLSARLADGAFFLKRDQQCSLEAHVEKLDQVVFLKGLGSIRDKSERLVILSGFLSDKMFPGVKADAVRAATLCKADLTTEMVGEFPELQGVMGRSYALADGEPAAVAEAILEHYQPKGADDTVPGSQVGVVVGVADKVDTIVGCLALGLKPTGTADPYGLRRASLGIIRTVVHHGLVISLAELVQAARASMSGEHLLGEAEIVEEVERFFRARLKAMFGAEASSDVIDAVVSCGVDDLSATAQKINVLSELKGSEEFLQLVSAFKRVANILKKETPDKGVSSDLFTDDAEKDLWNTFLACQGEVEEALKGREFQTAANHLISLKPSIDLFFNEVLVMAKDDAVRTNRLALLRELRDLFGEIADISRIQVDG